MSSHALQCYLHDSAAPECVMAEAQIAQCILVATVLVMATWCGQQRGIGKGVECRIKDIPSSISGKPVSCSTRCTGNEAFSRAAALPPVDTSSYP